jgi:hypothetical protein
LAPSPPHGKTRNETRKPAQLTRKPAQNPRNQKPAPQGREATDGAAFAVRITGDRVRLKYLARRLHVLGERPLFHYLDEVERGYPLREHLESLCPS